MEIKRNFMGIIITVIVAVILLTAIPILTNMSTEDCTHNIGHLDINPDFSSGDYNVDKDGYDYIDSATIIKDENLVPENIKKGVNIFGVVGTHDCPQYNIGHLDINPDFSGGDYNVDKDGYDYIDSATIIKDENLIPENIKKGVTVFGITGTLESGGVPLEQFVEFDAPRWTYYPGYRLLTFLSKSSAGGEGGYTPVDIKIYYKNGSDEDVLLVSKKEVWNDTINFIVIPRSYGNLKIVMSVSDDYSFGGWDEFSGFYARTDTGEVTQLTEPPGPDDVVLSDVEFDVFHVVFTTYGD